jgi:protoporphyrinogen IX oxidase
MAYLYIKTLHLILIASWFAGLFYLPRIFVNLAQEDNEVSYARLILMAKKLYKFMTILAVLALLTGFILFYEIMQAHTSPKGWLHAKLLCIVLICGYHHGCKKILHKFELNNNKRGHVFYRWFNEIPVVFFSIICFLVIVKPF